MSDTKKTGRLLIAGTGSGCGKTSIVCGLLRAYQKRGLALAACKCGPDYIDPLFHEKVLGIPSEIWIFSSMSPGCKSSFWHGTAGVRIW